MQNNKRRQNVSANAKLKKAEYEFSVKKGDVLVIPTHAIPYYAKYDNATDSSSEYSEAPGDISDMATFASSRTEQIRKTLLSLGFDSDGRLLSEDVIFAEPDQAAAFAPMVVCGKPVEIECVCLWDYFGGETCLDINCWARAELNVVAEEYQVRSLSSKEHMRLPHRWSLVRNLGNGSRSALGLIPSCWLVSKKFFYENPALFSLPLWYLGICDVSVAYRYLLSDHSAQRPGLFVIFSPVCLNPDPEDYRPFLLLYLCEKPYSFIKKTKRFFEEERHDMKGACGTQFYAHELERCNHPKPRKEQSSKESSGKKGDKKRRPKITKTVASSFEDEQFSKSEQKSDAAGAQTRSGDADNVKERDKQLDIIAEIVSSPFSLQMVTITRSTLGHYELFGNRYHTLYDLVYHLSQTDTELPHRLVYETLSVRASHPFCCVPPPFEQPTRDPRANLMHCEQWAARQFDQAVLPSLMNLPFQHTSRTVVDPHKQMHAKILRTLGIHEEATQKRRMLLSGPAIQKEITEFIDKYERPVKKEKNKEKESMEKPADKKGNQQPLEHGSKCPKDEFCIIVNPSVEVDQNNLNVDRMRPLGKGAFGAVYAGEFKTPTGNKVPVAVKSLRLVCSDKDQRLSWVTEVEMAQQLSHPNIIQFYGFCMEPTESSILIIFEMMDKGALDSFCRKLNYRMSVNETVDWLRQIARGMAYLHAQEPSIVHGDLAARNVLVTTHPVDTSRYIMKITDLGISKRTRTETFATYDDPNKIPFKWLPPEVLKGRELTPKTDVWSYGVLMHELYGIGEPYGMMGAEKVVHALNDGHRFERQPKMPHFIYDISLQCWRRLPADRPHFREIELLLRPHDVEYEASHMEILLKRFKKQKENYATHLNDNELDEADLMDRH